MNKVMVEHITIGVIGEEQIGEVLESGATDIIFKIISTERPSTMEELRVPAGNVKVKGNWVTIVDETTIDFSRILSVGYEEGDSDESL